MGVFMPTSIRVIRVLDNEYTVEVETEVEDIEELFQTLTKTAWGRKVAYLLGQMLPDIPEIKSPSSKEEAEAEQKRIEETEEKLRKEGYEKAMDEIREKFGTGNLDRIKKDITEKIREKYIKYIQDKRNPNKQKPKNCFLKYWERIEEASENADYAGGMAEVIRLRQECNDCIFKAECMKKSKKKDNS